MKSPVVVSREYTSTSVMLRAGKFGGVEKQLLGTARKLWSDFARVVEPIVLDVEGTLDTINKQPHLAVQLLDVGRVSTTDVPTSLVIEDWAIFDC